MEISVDNHLWLAFTLNTSHDYATKRFLRRFNCSPAAIFENRGLLLVGPIPPEIEDPEVEVQESDPEPEVPVGQLELFA
jgi:hypothetical protein